MNIDRLAGDGKRYENEMLSKSQIYVKFFGQKVTNLYVLFLDYAYEYEQLGNDQKQEIASLLRNQ